MTAADICKNPAILKVLQGSNIKGEEEPREEGIEAGDSESIRVHVGGGEEEDDDEDVFESKVEAGDQDAPSTDKRWRAKFGQSDREEPTSDEPHTASSGVESTRDASGGSSLTKVIGKATTFFSDISSSESESELPDVKLSHLPKKKRDSPLQSQEESEEEGKKKQAWALQEQEQGEEDEETSSTKEEAKVKISREYEGLTASGECPGEHCMHTYTVHVQCKCTCMCTFPCIHQPCSTCTCH